MTQASWLNTGVLQCVCVCVQGVRTVLSIITLSVLNWAPSSLLETRMC